MSSDTKTIDQFLAETKGSLKSYRLIDAFRPSLKMGEENARIVIQQTDATAMLCGGFEISNGALKACIELDALNAGLSLQIGLRPGDRIEHRFFVKPD